MRLTLFLFATLLAPGPAAEELTQRFLTRTDTQVTRYVALRHLEAKNQRFNVTGWLEACVTLSPEAGFRFAVMSEGGSAYVRNKVLRKALEGEHALVASGETARSSLSVENYKFHAEPSPTLGEATLRLTALRKDGLLINGRAIVTDPEADLLRVEGRLTKNPSFWTKSVDVMRRYEWRGGVRVPVEMTSVAEIRFAGRSTFRMTIDYVSVNGSEMPRAESTPTPCVGSAELPH